MTDFLALLLFDVELNKIICSKMRKRPSSYVHEMLFFKCKLQDTKYSEVLNQINTWKQTYVCLMKLQFQNSGQKFEHVPGFESGDPKFKPGPASNCSLEI